jgi:hypothetical protein
VFAQRPNNPLNPIAAKTQLRVNGKLGSRTRMISDRPISADELLQFEHYRQKGLDLLGASRGAAPRQLVEAIDSYVDEWQNKRRGLLTMLRARVDAVEPARALGVVWGDQIVRHFEWNWICEIRDSEERFAVASPNRSLVIHAPQFIHECLHNPQVDCTVMLAFNMQEAGNFTGCERGAYVDVMSGVHRIVPKR